MKFYFVTSTVHHFNAVKRANEDSDVMFSYYYLKEKKALREAVITDDKSKRDIRKRRR